MSLQLQPKINQHKVCGCCGTFGLRLIEVFIPATQTQTSEGGAVATETSAKKDLCGYCVVGLDLPVQRQTQGWQYGEIVSFDRRKFKPFLVKFIGTDEEWVDIGQQPTRDYLASIRIAAEGQPQGDSLAHLEWLDRFNNFNCTEDSPLASLSSFSSLSSMGAFDPLQIDGPSILPLFIDDKVDNVETLAFVNVDVEMQESSSSEDSTATESLAKDVALEVKPKGSAIRTPKRWTKEEDKLLVKIVDSFHKKGIKPKWPDVASQVPSRNGKQCRERYVNHLSSTLKPKIWHQSEDVMIMHLFVQYNTSWRQLAKYFRGRTDNGVKNRFWNLHRWLEKDYRSKKYIDDDDSISSDDMVASMHQKIQVMLADIAAESLGGVTFPRYKFGKLKKVKRLTQCKRCCLFIPSAQTGRRVCPATKWCEACCNVPTYVGIGDALRNCLNKRMAHDDFMLD